LVLLILFVVAGALTGGVWGALEGLIVTFFFLGVPIASWRLVASRGSETVLRQIVLRRPLEKIMRLLRIAPSHSSEYVLVGSPRVPSSLAWRMVQTVSVVFLIASDATLYLATTSRNNPVGEVTSFFGYGFVSLSLVVPFLALLWVYEDAGLRRYDIADNTVSKVGAWLEQVFVGTGVASAFLKFVLSLGSGSAETSGAVFALFIVLVFPCLIVTVLFHTEGSAKYVKKFLASKSAQGLMRRTVELQQ